MADRDVVSRPQGLTRERALLALAVKRPFDFFDQPFLVIIAILPTSLQDEGVLERG